MNPKSPNEQIQSSKLTERSPINDVEEKIDTILDSLSSAGVDTSSWNSEYFELPDDLDALTEFHKRLTEFVGKRGDALLSFEFFGDYSEQEKAEIRRLDRDVEASFRNPEGFLGNGATAEVYEMPSNDVFCVKFIINQDRYNENNHMRKEFGFLSKVYMHTRDQKITTPYPAFLCIHANRGHSYGMEKIHGASLSQIIESPQKYQRLIDEIAEVDRGQAEKDLIAFVRSMHEAGVLHQDLYQRNIMFSEEGRLYVIDFGKSDQIDFVGQREDERKRDELTATQSLRDFFDKIDVLTKKDK